MGVYPLHYCIVIEEQRLAKPHEWDLPRVRQVVHPRFAQRHDGHQLLDIQPPSRDCVWFGLHKRLRFYMRDPMPTALVWFERGVCFGVSPFL